MQISYPKFKRPSLDLFLDLGLLGLCGSLGDKRQLTIPLDVEEFLGIRFWFSLSKIQIFLKSQVGFSSLLIALNLHTSIVLHTLVSLLALLTRGVILMLLDTNVWALSSWSGPQEQKGEFQNESLIPPLCQLLIPRSIPMFDSVFFHGVIVHCHKCLSDQRTWFNWIFNGFTAKRVPAGTKNSHSVGFLR